MNKRESAIAEQRELEIRTDIYRMVTVGGRIKTAGASMSILYETAEPLITTPSSPDAAMEVSRAFAALKKDPPIQLKKAYFPQNESTMKAVFSGLGIYRPTIKTDQGPAGNVGHFYIDPTKPSALGGRIVKEQGVALPEAFFQKGVDSNTSFDKLIKDAQAFYQRGDYARTFQSIARIRELGQEHGVETTRRAGVGRQEFFFFRPVATDERVSVGSELAEAISQKTQEVVAKVELLAQKAKKAMKEGATVIESIHYARASTEKSFDKKPHMTHFQPDVMIRKDGSFEIERINIPDLGMFLTEVTTPLKNPTLQAVKDINAKIRNQVLDAITTSSPAHITILTRPEVLENQEDTLEQLEITAIEKGLAQREVDVSINSLSAIDSFPNGSSLLLLNVSPETEGFTRLLERVSAGELFCNPDPFLKLFEQDATTFDKKTVSQAMFSKFMNIIAPQHMDKKEGVLTKFNAIQKMLLAGGVDSDIVYFHVNGVAIPTFRYDVKSFFEVHKAITKAQARDIEPEVTITPIPFRPEDAIMIGADGPRLSVFRFMFVKQ